MTPTEIITLARQLYNAVGSDFYSDLELLSLIYLAESDLARRALLINNVYSTTTVASTRDYAYPTNAIAIKKITWYGKPLIKIDLMEDDAITGNDEATLSEGDPQYYAIWENSIVLRPIPSSAQALKIWTYDLPSIPSIGSTLDVPIQYHPDIVFYLLAHMVAKDEKYDLYDRYNQKWENSILRAIKDVSKQRRGDKMAHVKDEETLGSYVFRGI